MGGVWGQWNVACWGGGLVAIVTKPALLDAKCRIPLCLMKRLISAGMGGLRAFLVYIR